jgi:hypothetical protein
MMPKGSVVEWSFVVPNLNAVGFLLFCCVFGKRRLVFYCVFDNAVIIHIITQCANFRISNIQGITSHMATGSRLLLKCDGTRAENQNYSFDETDESI